MEYVDHDLLGLLKSSRMGFSNWLSIDAIRWIMYQLFSSLAYLHRNNVIHRDIKPANLLITSQCDLRLADFGLSRRIGNPLITKYTSRVITLWYRPPELILGSTFYGPEVDIWSAGCILVELLTGTTLFPNYNNNEYYQLQLIFSRCGYPDDPLLLNLMKWVTIFIHSIIGKVTSYSMNHSRGHYPGVFKRLLTRSRTNSILRFQTRLWIL